MEYICIHAPTSTKVIVWILISLCFKYLIAPGEWLLGLTVSLHKKGKKDNPSNYRGITLLDNVSKVYAAILISRMMKYGEEVGNVFSEEQGGYRIDRGDWDGSS